jgi:uncharacterized protein YcgI (DUF1989 family)
VTNSEIIIDGGHGSAFKLQQGSKIQITNIEGSQVVDLWAYSSTDSNEFLSNEHTRSCLEKLIPTVGDCLYSSRRREIIKLVADTSVGIHDLLLSACDIQRYELLGHVGYHRNCADNLREALAEFEVTISDVPSPFNLFENVQINEQGGLSIQPPLVKAGESVTIEACMNIVLVLSSCPMDIALTNGPDLRSKPVRVKLL